MKVTIRRLMELVRFILLFVTCTLISYGIITILSSHLLPANPYHEPHGNAVKVVKIIDQTKMHNVDWYYSRLQLFFMVGE